MLISTHENRRIGERFAKYNQNFSEVGAWQIKASIEPNLKIVLGTYRDACLRAITVKGFFQWGFGGKVLRFEGIENV